MAGRSVAATAEIKKVGDLLEQMKPQISKALPKHLDADRMIRVALAAVNKNPKLLECTRNSLYSAILTCSQLGLEMDSPLGHAYMIPFKSRGTMMVQLVIGYKGLLHLARNSGEIKSIQAHEVCEQDHFDFRYGLNETLDHVPAQGDRGQITHFYAYAQMKDGGSVFEVMTLHEVEKIRDGSANHKSAKQYNKASVWDEHFVQMGRKTLIRRLGNYLPLNIQRAAALDAAYEEHGKAAHLDDGDLVIDGDFQQVSDDAEDTAEDDTPSEAKPEQEPEKAKPQSKPEPKPAAGKKKPDPEPEPEPDAAPVADTGSSNDLDLNFGDA